MLSTLDVFSNTISKYNESRCRAGVKTTASALSLSTSPSLGRWGTVKGFCSPSSSPYCWQVEEDSGLLICSLLWGKPRVNATAILILKAKDLSPLARFVKTNRRELAIRPVAYVPTQGVIQATWPSTKTLARLFLALLGLPRLPRREPRAEPCDIEL